MNERLIPADDQNNFSTYQLFDTGDLLGPRWPNVGRNIALCFYGFFLPFSLGETISYAAEKHNIMNSNNTFNLFLKFLFAPHKITKTFVTDSSQDKKARVAIPLLHLLIWLGIGLAIGFLAPEIITLTIAKAFFFVEGGIIEVLSRKWISGETVLGGLTLFFHTGLAMLGLPDTVLNTLCLILIH
jgi:hypothetical protein